jgi:hypothetical protein
MPSKSAAVDAVIAAAKELCETARTAQRGGKSLKGDNFYGRKFHDQKVAFARAETLLFAELTSTRLDDATRRTLQLYLNNVKDEQTTVSLKSAAVKSLELLAETVLRPALANADSDPVSPTEPVLPGEVVKGTRGYLERIVTQANVCYETKCFDASSVMIRKLIEVLILAVYEGAGRATDIKNSAGDFLMLGDVIAHILGDTQFNLARETKRSLPDIKTLGDRSAHNRHYLASRADVDRVVGGLRVCVDDLLHLAKLK